MLPQKKKAMERNKEITLEDIRRKKAQIRKKLDVRKSSMMQKTQALFTQPTETSSARIFGVPASNIDKSLSIIKGAMIGFAIIRKVRKFLR